MNAPAITVVVFNYNGDDYLRGCLASLARQTFTDFETIVIDNSSSDDSLLRIDKLPPRTTILPQEANLGFAGGNNVGARAGRGRWLALLNHDAEAWPRLARRHDARGVTPPHSSHGRLTADQPARARKAGRRGRLLPCL